MLAILNAIADNCFTFVQCWTHMAIRMFLLSAASVVLNRRETIHEPECCTDAWPVGTVLATVESSARLKALRVCALFDFSIEISLSLLPLIIDRQNQLKLSQWKIQSRHTLSNSARKRSVCSVDAPVCLGTHGSFSCRVGETISIGLIRNNEVRDLFQWRNRKAQTRARLWALRYCFNSCECSSNGSSNSAAFRLRALSLAGLAPLRRLKAWDLKHSNCLHAFNIAQN